MKKIGNVETFENFIVAIPENISVPDYNTVIIWCEAFEEFITSSQYQ